MFQNAPATFQRVMDVFLSTVKEQHALVYLDDNVVVSKRLKDHIDHTRSVLRLLQYAGVTLKLQNCAFFTNQIDIFEPCDQARYARRCKSHG